MGTNIESVGVGKGDARSSRDGLSDETRESHVGICKKYPIQWKRECKGFGAEVKSSSWFLYFFKVLFFSLKAQTKKSKKNLWPKQVVDCKVWKYLLSIPL